MDTMKLIASLVTAVIGVSSMNTPDTKPIDKQASLLVAEWPVSDLPKDTEEIQSPKPDPIPDMVAEAMQSYRPKQQAESHDCKCDCDCPDEGRLRIILREEFATALRERMNATQSTGNGSTGGSTGNASTGGQVVTTSSYYSTPAPMITRSVSEAAPTPAFTAPQSRTVSYFRDYQATNGCTVRETTYSDGTTSTQTISCPLQNRRRIFNR